MKIKGFAMKKIGEVGWIEKDAPACGPLDALVKPLAVSPCSSDIHTVYSGALGDRPALCTAGQIIICFCSAN